MQKENDRAIKIKFFNVFKEWAIKLVGFGYSESPWYQAYIRILLVFNLVMLMLGAIAVYLVRHQSIYVLAGIHFIMGVNFTLTMLNLKIMATRTIKKAIRMNDEGIYIYEENDFQDEYNKLQLDVTQDLKWRTKIYVAVYVSTYSLLMYVTPVLGYYLFRNSKFYSDKHVNNYIPHIFYTPFSTRTPLGFAAAYAIDVIYWTYVSTSTYSAISILAMGSVNLQLHLKVLNYSLRNIETRAVHMFEKKTRQHGAVPPRSGLLKKKEFQDCLNSCLRANIQHHQTLIAYKALYQPFFGPTLVAVYSVIAVVLYAALLTLILQPLPLSMKLKYMCLLASEEMAGYYISSLGEGIINESNKLFESIYSTSWFNYNKSFRKTLSIMMSYAMKPMKLKGQHFDVTASRESFGELIKNTYSLMNFIRPSTQ